jgi:hypothetical protein
VSECALPFLSPVGPLPGGEGGENGGVEEAEEAEAGALKWAPAPPAEAHSDSSLSSHGGGGF